VISVAAAIMLAGQAIPAASASGDAVRTIALVPVQSGPAAANRNWTQYYMIAARMIKAGRWDDAGAWFYVGQLRGRINVNCVKQAPSGGPAALASLNEIVGKPINEYLGANPDKWAMTIQRALDWDARHADAQNSGPACMSAKRAQREGLASLKRYVLSHKDEIRRERRKNGLPNS
jgi:hypothetical protein